MWLEDSRNGSVLAVTHQTRLGIRGVAPGGKEERDLGWFGWSELHDISRDGHKILFDEEGDGGGPNYTVFLRDTDGSPPLRIGDGNAMAISPDGKWAITKPAKGGPLSLVPTGAGEAKQLTHDAVSYVEVHWMPDGKHLLAQGIEAGHGARLREILVCGRLRVAACIRFLVSRRNTASSAGRPMGTLCTRCREDRAIRV